jgi:flagellar biosynthetic protein FliQ
MTEGLFLELVQRTLLVIIELSMPVLLASLLIGLCIGLFQAVTQIQEATLTFVPKIIISLGTLSILGPWMLRTFVAYVSELYQNINLFI